MIMHTNSGIHELAHAVRQILHKGIFLNAKALHFIDSTFFSPTTEEIVNIMHDSDNCERDTLIALIFFPSEAMQVALEPLLIQHKMDAAGKEDLIRAVKNGLQEILIHLPDQRGGFSISLVKLEKEAVFPLDFALGHFVFHLNIAKILPESLSAVIDTHVAGPMNRITRVKLRNSRIDFSEKNIIWLRTLLHSFLLWKDVFEEVLDFAPGFLETVSGTTDYYERLMALKISYCKAILKNTAFDAAMRKSNMETLILQGKRSAGMDSRVAEKKMAVIDRIAYAVYGKTLWIEPVFSENDLAECVIQPSITEILKHLGT